MALTDPLIGKRLGDYLIESVLGTGGMARVYKGYDDNLDRYAAIKVIEPQLIASAEEDEYRERFLREARAIARLNHSRIVSVYQFNQVGNLYYIAMEYVRGDNLRDILRSYLKQGRVLPTEELLLVLRDISDALDYAHKQGIIHRDVKPSNIIVTPDGNAVLTDFGLALNAVEGTIGNTFGSVHYIAPEQAISSAQAVPASDQYSLGIVAYELLTGRVPFDDASAMSVALKHISDPPPPPTEINPNIPAEVEQVLLRSLDKEPTRRFESCKAFVQAMELAFEMFNKGDVAAPKAIVEALGAPPVTSPVPPPSRVGEKLKTGTMNAVDDSWDSSPKRNTNSIPLADNPRAGWFVAAILVLIILAVGGYLLFSQIQSNNANATSTAEAIAIQQTDTSNRQTSIALTETFLIQQQTEDALTEISASETTIARQTSNAVGTTEQEAATSTALMLSLQETSIAATARLDATASAQSLVVTEEATEVLVASETEIVPTATDTVAPISPTASLTLPPEITPTLTPSATLTPSITPLPTNTATPSLFIEIETDVAQVLLRYDGRMLILGNRDEANTVDLSEMIFVQVAPDENGIFRETVVFAVARAGFSAEAQELTISRCLQILDSTQFSGLPSQNPLAEDLCGGRPFWVTSVAPFWINDDARAYFEVRLGPVDVLTRCPVQRALTRAELRCVIDVNAIR